MVTDPHEILKEEKIFYHNLYTEKEVILRGGESQFFFSQDIPKLDEAMKQSCEEQLTFQECKDILSSFKNGKTPGNDGLLLNFL